MSTLSMMSRSATRSAGKQPTRALHASARTAIAARYPSDRLPAGVDPDAFVPPYYVERSRHRREVVDELIAHDSLMVDLSSNILANDIQATITRLGNKIPTEHTLNGVTVHPSGFVVPTPGDAVESYADIRERDIAVQTAAVAARVNEDSSLSEVTARVRALSSKVPYEVVAADGTVCHPSGFVPPTPAHKFASAPQVRVSQGDVTLRETSGPAARTPWKQG